MKVIKIFLLILASFFVIWLIASAVFPSHYHLERSIVIDAPPKTVFDQVNNLKTWEKWSYWQQLDTEAVIIYEGPEAGPGSKSSWEGEKIGKGSMIILDSENPVSINIELDFAGEGKAYSGFKFESVDGKTNVIWDFDSDVGFSQRVFMALMMDKLLGLAYETGLENLKESSEGQSGPASVKVEEVDVPVQWVLTKRDSCGMDDITQTLSDAYQSIMIYMESESLKSTGPPLAIWHKFEMESDFVDIEAGVPVADSSVIGHGMNLIKLGGRAMKTTHWGAYDQMNTTYEVLTEWLKERKVISSGPPWEVYVTDPMEVKDTSQWQTDIYFPI